MLEEKGRSSKGSFGFGREVRAAADASYSENFVPEDLINFAHVMPELAGRIGTIVQLRELDEDAYMHILGTPSMSPIYQLEEEYCISITIPEETKRGLCSEAVRTKLGVRGLRSRIQDQLDREMFSNPGQKEFTLFGSEPAALES